MRIACIMFHKNERDYLEPCLAYYSWLVGLKSVFVFDNGSTDQRALEVLARYEDRGLKVDYSRRTAADFRAKGDIIAAKIRELDRTDPHDFYFPLDCDEFLAAMRDDRPVIGREAVEDALGPFLGDQRVLAISHGFNNNPLDPGLYRSNPQRQKVFFAKGSCLSLDKGFHVGATTTGAEKVRTRIAYIHQHYRSYEAYRYFSLLKLETSTRQLTRVELRRLQRERGSGHHLVMPTLASREEYYSIFSGNEWQTRFTGLHERLAELGAPLPADDSGEYADLAEIPEGVELPDPRSLQKRIMRRLRRAIDTVRGKHRPA